ncbi:MAG: transglutaminase family protein, partial [Comamonadaceae bacterium]
CRPIGPGDGNGGHALHLPLALSLCLCLRWPRRLPRQPLLLLLHAHLGKGHHRDPHVQHVARAAVQALAQRRGVCQDFAHIQIACLRNLGLAARYVSGYLLTQPPPGQPRLIGADASHAWVELYLPPLRDEADASVVEDGHAVGGQWVGFCPTNGRQPGEDYVKLAVGRDFADVSPMRGILHGGARHVLDVGVTVMPFAEMSMQQQQQWLPGSGHASRPAAVQLGQPGASGQGQSQLG